MNFDDQTLLKKGVERKKNGWDIYDRLNCILVAWKSETFHMVFDRDSQNMALTMKISWHNLCRIQKIHCNEANIFVSKSLETSDLWHFNYIN